MSTFAVRNKFFGLLLALTAFFVITPFIVNSQIDLYLFGSLFTIVLFFGVFAVTHNKLLIVSGAVLALLIFAGLWVNNLFVKSNVLLMTEYFLMIIYFIILTVVVLYSVFKHEKVTFNTICGAICGYLLIGMVWSFAYSIIYHLQTGAFNFPDVIYVLFDSHFQRFTYYSFVTLTTLGYGDITPISNVAKTFAWIEAVIGQVYLTVWVAQLVALHITQKMQKKGS